jgi:hypothetical protein
MQMMMHLSARLLLLVRTRRLLATFISTIVFYMSDLIEKTLIREIQDYRWLTRNESYHLISILILCWAPHLATAVTRSIS